MIKRNHIISKTIAILLMFLMSIINVHAAPADQAGSVGVDAYIPCSVTLTTRPEKRVLSPNPQTKEANPNRQTTVTLHIYDGSTFITQFEGNSTSDGVITFDPCDPSYQYPADALGNQSYSIYVKGLSHLRHAYTRTLGVTNFATAINLVNDNSDSSLAARSAHYNSFSNIVEYEAYSQDLYAGEISVVFDNFLNALDFSVLSSKYNSNDNKSDLNQDQTVNALDFSIVSTNFWKGGALLPGQSWSQAAQNFFSARQSTISNQ